MRRSLHSKLVSYCGLKVNNQLTWETLQKLIKNWAHTSAKIPSAKCKYLHEITEVQSF